MAELRETHIVKEREGNGVAPWLAFLVGALLIGIVAVFLLNAHGSFNGPAGHVDFYVKSPVTVPTAPAR